MTIRLTFEEVKQVGLGIWQAPLTPAEVRSLGRPTYEIGIRSVLMLTTEAYRLSEGSLSIDPNHLVVINVGSSDHSLVLSVGAGQDLPITSFATNNLKQPAKTGTYRSGDYKFLREAQRLLNGEMARVGQRLLEGIRSNVPGHLLEGKARKFVNSPDNVVAVTIQPRDRSYAIHVKGDPKEFGATEFEISLDRRPYCRFKLTHPSQLDDALKIIHTSAQRHGKPETKPFDLSKIGQNAKR